MFPYSMFRSLKNVSLKYTNPHCISIPPFWYAGNVFFQFSFVKKKKKKVFILPLSLKDIFTTYRILGWQLFSFIFFNTSFHCVLAFTDSVFKSQLSIVLLFCRSYSVLGFVKFSVSTFIRFGKFTLIIPSNIAYAPQNAPQMSSGFQTYHNQNKTLGFLPKTYYSLSLLN